MRRKKVLGGTPLLPRPLEKKQTAGMRKVYDLLFDLVTSRDQTKASNIAGSASSDQTSAMIFFEVFFAQSA